LPFTVFKRHALLAPIAILTIGLMLQFAFSAGWTTYAIYRYEQGWCTLLDDVVTSGPAPQQVPPPGPGASEIQKLTYHRWRVYEDLIRLKGNYRCS